MSLELKEIPYNGWEEKYKELMKDKYLSCKYNRERRLKDHVKYINECTPEIKHCTGKTVLEIGCGMGEWLELCREYGHKGMGIEAELADCEMGNEYAKMIKLMAERQELDIKFVDFEKCLSSRDYADATGAEMKDSSVFYINMRGCIEQCFKRHMIGPPHKETKDCSKLAWAITPALWDLFYKMFEEFNRILEDGGYLYIWANGSKNDPEYDNLILQTLKKFPTLHLFQKKGKLRHKICKRL